MCIMIPNPDFKSGITKADNINPHAFSNKSTTKTSCQSEISHLPYLLRIEIDREKMAEKEIKLIDIVSQFCNWWEMRFVDAKNVERRKKSYEQNYTIISNV